MIFKYDYLHKEFESRPQILKDMAHYFESLSLSVGVDPVVTRILEKVAGSSGVHEAGRAIDFRSQYIDQNGKLKKLYSEEDVARFLDLVNTKYKRNDGRKTLIHHSFNNGPLHFHLQSGASLSLYEDDIRKKYGTT
jgi:hypothetical protein